MAERKIEMRDGERVSIFQATGSVGDLETGHMVVYHAGEGGAIKAEDSAAAAITGVIGVSMQTQLGIEGYQYLEIARKKAFRFANSTIAPVSPFVNAYVEDSVTVCSESGAINNVIAGLVVHCESDDEGGGIWVEIG